MFVGPTFFSDPFSAGGFRSAYTRLLGTFPSGSLADQSMYAIGDASLYGAAGVASNGKYSFTFSSTVERYIYWQHVDLEVLSATGKTIEFLIKAIEVTTNPAAGMIMARVNCGNVDFTINLGGLVSGANKMSIVRVGAGVLYTAPTDFFDGLKHHFAFVMRTTGALDIYYRGVRVIAGVAYARKSPALNYGYIQLGHYSQVGQTVTFEHHGVRYRNDEFYSGASFTPPDVLEDVAP